MNRRSAIKRGVGALAVGGGLAVAARYGGRAALPHLARQASAGQKMAYEAGEVLAKDIAFKRHPKLAAVARFYRKTLVPSATDVHRAQRSAALGAARMYGAEHAARGARFAEKRAGVIGLGGAGAGAVATPDRKKR